MAFAMLVEIPGVDRETYERVVKKVNEQGGTPRGSIFHAGGPIEGGYRLFELWESREHADAFYASDVLKTATAGAGAQGHPNIIMTWPVYGKDDGTGWKAIR